MTQTYKAEVWEGEKFDNLARVVDNIGNVLVQSDVSGWDVYVFNRTDPASPNAAIYSLTGQAASAAVFDTLQTDGRWTRDSTGYNFRDTPGDTAVQLMEGGKTYRWEYHLNLTSSRGTKKGVFYVVCRSTDQG